MLDHYSNYPPPSQKVAIEEVINEIKKSKLSYDEDKLRKIATEVIVSMPSLGSYTGWYVGFRGDAIKNVLIQYAK